MPEYFLALVKQFGNFSSNDSAEQTSLQIVDALGVCLSKQEQQKLVTLLPQYLAIHKKHFLLSAYKKDVVYSHELFVNRLMHQTALTDKSELNNHLKAFFYALAIVKGKKSHLSLKKALPEELRAFCVQYT